MPNRALTGCQEHPTICNSVNHDILNPDYHVALLPGALRRSPESPNMESGREDDGFCNDGRKTVETTANKKVVVVMGATGVGKSRLAIDLAEHFAGVEIINADSMQVYGGLDVLTNKVSLADRRGVPHHLLGTIDPSVQFTSKDFRDTAIPIIDDILSRGCLPVIVGGTNYYIQALASPYLVDDVVQDMPESSTNLLGDIDLNHISSSSAFELLKEIDSIAANKIHPNDHRKISRYLSVYASSGVLPSSLFQGYPAEKWGRADNFRYTCCFIWVDASLSVLDEYVNARVDCMIDSGLLNEVCDIFKLNANYTRGMKQAIGVREFEEFFKVYSLTNELLDHSSTEKFDINIPNSVHRTDTSKPKISEILLSKDSELHYLLVEAIDKFKANTRKLVRRQKRRLNHLKNDFGWNIKYIDGTEAFSVDAVDSWSTFVVEPSIKIIAEFLIGADSLTHKETSDAIIYKRQVSKDLCAQYVCEACGNRVLRGAHEWEQHKNGRTHRKRFSRFNKHLKSALPQKPDYHTGALLQANT